MRPRNFGDPWNLVGFDVPAADGGDYGHRVFAYDTSRDEFKVQAIKWSTGTPLKGPAPDTIDAYKITYRYVPQRRRKSVEHAEGSRHE